MAARLRRHRRITMALFGLVLLAVPAAVAMAQSSAKVSSTTFSLFPNPTFEPCLAGSGGSPAVTATVTRGGLNDTMKLWLSHFKPGLDFDLFTVQRSNQTASGAPVTGFKNFGLAWYQSDIHVGSTGSASVTVRTILLDQIFRFDPDTSTTPTNTFHVGFWFNSVADAQGCSTTTLTPTPFNGERPARIHHAAEERVGSALHRREPVHHAAQL